MQAITGANERRAMSELAHCMGGPRPSGDPRASASKSLPRRGNQQTNVNTVALSNEGLYALISKQTPVHLARSGNEQQGELPYRICMARSGSGELERQSLQID